MTKQPGKTLDLDEFAEKQNWKLEIVSEEHPQERSFRHTQEAADAKMRRVREAVILVLAAGFVLAIATTCMATTLSHETSAEEKKWAWATLTLITGAVLGYLFGKASSTNK